MKPQIKLATAQTPDGGKMELYQHDTDFLIKINGQELMNSRHHESEQELARLGCANLSSRRAPRVLIGGLGMGYTLRQTLDMLGPTADVVVSELLTAVVAWNYEYLKDLNGGALDDKRTNLITGDIIQLLSQSIHKFDAILLDVDNGPNADHRFRQSTFIQPGRNSGLSPGATQTGQPGDLVIRAKQRFRATLDK